MGDAPLWFSQNSNAVSCSLKKLLCWKFKSSEITAGSCCSACSAATSHASHSGCWCIGGSRGQLTGAQPHAFMMRSASMKFRNREARSKSWRNSFWNRLRGNMFQAIVSVMEVNIQLSSPKSVLRSVCFPGIRSSLSIPTEFLVSADRVRHLQSRNTNDLPTRLVAQIHT